MPSLQEIDDLSEELRLQLESVDEKMHKIRDLQTNLNIIKMQPRLVITPATDTEPEKSEDVFDIMPNDPHLSNKKMLNPRRQEIFNDVKAKFATL